MHGYHFALTPDQERCLLAAADPDDQDAVGEILEEIEEYEVYTDDLRVESDKAWDAIHRCLSDGSLNPDRGKYPLSFGGRHMHDDYYVRYVTAAEACEVAGALHGIDEGGLRRKVRPARRRLRPSARRVSATLERFMLPERADRCHEQVA